MSSSSEICGYLLISQCLRVFQHIVCSQQDQLLITRRFIY
uniref:Uncharacterized protein n=1 Tax=Arundo donax TaxID=35708 RepID=A0A0A9GYG8_ARUDO